MEAWWRSVARLLNLFRFRNFLGHPFNETGQQAWSGPTIYSLLAIAVAFGCLKKALFAIEKPKGHWFACNTGKVCSFEFADAAALTLCCWRTLTSPVPRLSVSYFDRHWFKWNCCICWIQFYPFELHQGISISSWLHELTCVVLQTDMNSREWCVKLLCNLI